MRPEDLTTAKTVAKISVASNTAGGKKSVARRYTGLDYSFSKASDRAKLMVSQEACEHFSRRTCLVRWPHTFTGC